MGYVKCLLDNCDQWFKFDENLPVNHEQNQFCFYHGGKITSMNPQEVPFRRCIHLNERGMQCDVYFPADTGDKLCEEHRGIASPGTKNGQSEEQKVRYIDLVNDERKYCYHFLDGSSQNQKQELIFEFKDDSDGTIFEKLERHIAYLEKVLEDVKARLHSALAVKGEKLQNLSEEERKKLRAIKIDKAVRSPESKPRTKIEKTKDEWKNVLSSIGASFDMNPDEIIARFKATKEKK